MEKLTEEQVKEIALEESEVFEVIEDVKGDSGRWYTVVTTIFKNPEDGKTYSIYWSCGLTECQEHMFEALVPKWVEQRVEMIERKYWAPVKNQEEKQNGE